MTTVISLQSPAPAAIHLLKKSLRLRMRQIRSTLPDREREYANQRILQQLIQHEIYQRAQVIHTYVSLRDEVDTHEFIRIALRAGRQVAVPKVQRETRMLAHYFIGDFAALAPGILGILEPCADAGAQQLVAKDKIDLVLVPGLAFDRQGHRLGYGAGHYDRFLAKINAPKIGLAFAAQIVESIPAAPHDRPVDFVMTENEVLARDPML
ncbi:MAG: 5-formyltetrahydrofolate cyclo-ligase [bacterium]